MSSQPWRPDWHPAAAASSGGVQTVLPPRQRNLGDGFTVRRLLPASEPRAVGWFVFFDHFGPTQFAPGQGLDVRPHPHINLATVTYLFEGEILHRDSLGSQQTIRPGDINWMNAGRGIVHSERTPPVARAAGSLVHGLQLWVALPRDDEESDPTFHHHPAATLPRFLEPGVEGRVLVGEAFGLRSPVRTFSPLLYLDLRLEPGAAFQLPDHPEERAVYLVDGEVTCEGQTFERAHLLSLRRGHPIVLRANGPCRLVLVGGTPLPEPRHLWWNFVSSSQARIEQAKRDWRQRRGDPAGPFPLVPGDASDFIPLPEA